MTKRNRKKERRKLSYILIGGNYWSSELEKFSNIEGVAVVGEEGTHLSRIVFEQDKYPIKQVYALINKTDGRLRTLMRGSMRLKEFDKLHID